jgi:branched-chain amino acid aminotransferase
MPCLIRLLAPDGLRPAPYTADSLADAEQHEPHDGVYTITNTFRVTQVLKLDAHLDRMENSARLAGISLMLDRPRLRAALRGMILESGFGDVRFRVTAPAHDPATLILSVEPFRPPAPEVYRNGVRVVTVPGAHRDNPGAKTSGWLHDRKAIESAFPAGVYTGILLGENDALLEGMSSNFYAIMDGALHTAVEGVLPGISQQIVLDTAPSVLPLHTTPVTMADLPRVQEAFITSASRGIVPVVQIDEHVLGNGMPGPLTLRLRDAYQAWVDAHLEEI